VSALGVLRRVSALAALMVVTAGCAVADRESAADTSPPVASTEASATTTSDPLSATVEDDRSVETDRAVEVVGSESTESESSGESAPSTSAPASATTEAVVTDRGLLDRLRVEPEADVGGYDRELFAHWRDTNGSGCDARHDTLARQVIGFAQVDLFDSCVIVEGDWYSIYDGVSYSGAPVEMQIDHVVALAEAWESGAWAWDEATRRAFANDPAHLVAVTGSSNGAKKALDLAEWRPIRSAWCVTATITAEVKAAYGLSVDSAEYDAIAEMLAVCGDVDQVGVGVAPAAPASVVTVPVTAPPSEDNASESATGCVDVNTATLEALDTIIHIGPSRAAAIVSLRPFASVDDLVRVSGIGASRLADIVDQGIACVG